MQTAVVRLEMERAPEAVSNMSITYTGHCWCTSASFPGPPLTFDLKVEGLVCDSQVTLDVSYAFGCGRDPLEQPMRLFLASFPGPTPS